MIERASYGPGFILRQVIVVASGVDPSVLAHVESSANQYDNVILIEEPTRKGKAEAINRIIERFSGDFLVLINSDAHPEPEAISTILNVVVSDDNVGLVSASPVIGESGGVTGSVLKLMWDVHNECLATLNEVDMNNHCCDELIVIRSEALRKLPNGTVNDGAFLAGVAYRAGYAIRFCKDSKVKIDVPIGLPELLRQRRRIVYGHVQVLRSVGKLPRTLESMILNNPKLGLMILIRTIAKSPRLVLALPIAIVGELFSVICAAIDSLTPTKKHVMWDRVGLRA
jgi:cellulose synthase/poly-beta-1,6-N-acetylglucosamine synthase-like glycosyltransferase